MVPVYRGGVEGTRAEEGVSGLDFQGGDGAGVDEGVEDGFGEDVAVVGG